MKSIRSDKTDTEEHPSSLAATSAVCCGALFGGIIKVLDKLVELEWDSKQFWLLVYALVIMVLLCSIACFVYSKELRKKKQEATNAPIGTIFGAGAANSAALNDEFGSAFQNELEQLNKERLRSEIQRNKAVTRCAKEARRLILVVAFLLFIRAMNRSGH